jgi:hypothetical protein
MAATWTASSHGIAWRLELERDTLLPGRLVGGRITATADDAFEARRLLVALRAEEHWKYEVTTTDAQGHTSTRVETARNQLVNEPVAVADSVVLTAGESRSWDIELPVPPLGPATLEANVAGLDWTVAANMDVPGGLDPVIEGPVRVVQPVALLRAGVVPLEAFALYGPADVAADGVTGTITLAPVPLCAGEAFTATVALQAGESRQLQEIRAELRVHVKAAVPTGLAEDIVAWSSIIPATELAGDRTIQLQGTLDPRLLPSIELPHGRAAATFHLILAVAWARDTHLIRDVAIATTHEL